MRSWSFVRFGCKCQHTNEGNKDIEDSYYDAFVTYSGIDSEFVDQELVPRLEEPMYGKEGYTFCLHERDSPASERTADAIIKVIKNSKRVIVVLSNNYYLRSRWCKYEPEQAHNQLVQEDRNRIIMILLEEVDPALMHTEIENYMTTRIYLKYSDPKLWAKLYHAMPLPRIQTCARNLNQDNDNDTVEFLEKFGHGSLSSRRFGICYNKIIVHVD